jgi:hypothetical protein
MSHRRGRGAERQTLPTLIEQPDANGQGIKCFSDQTRRRCAEGGGIQLIRKSFRSERPNLSEVVEGSAKVAAECVLDSEAQSIRQQQHAQANNSDQDQKSLRLKIRSVAQERDELRENPDDKEVSAREK